MTTACARRPSALLFVKFFNAGQICTTVDHAYIPRAKLAGFVEMARPSCTSATPASVPQDFTSVIDPAGV